MKTWWLIESPPADIFSQMILDYDLFEERIQSPHSPPILRIYQVQQPAITVGRFWAKFVKDRQFDIPVCVRPTGGGLVYHGSDLIYSIIASRDAYPTFRQVRTSYLSFQEAVQDAFQRLGIETRLFRCDEAKREEAFRRKPVILEECFTHPIATDVLCRGQKIAGGGQWRKSKAFLHQGSIQILEQISFDPLKEALKRSFEDKFGIQFVRSSVEFDAAHSPV